MFVFKIHYLYLPGKCNSLLSTKRTCALESQHLSTWAPLTAVAHETTPKKIQILKKNELKLKFENFCSLIRNVPWSGMGSPRNLTLINPHLLLSRYLGNNSFTGTIPGKVIGSMSTLIELWVRIWWNCCCKIHAYQSEMSIFCVIFHDKTLVSKIIFGPKWYWYKKKNCSCSVPNLYLDYIFVLLRILQNVQDNMGK